MKVLDGGCRVFGGDDGPVVTHGSWSSRTLVCRENGAEQIAQTINEYGPGRSPTVVNPGAEEVLYIMRGEGVCYVNGHAYPVKPGNGIYIPVGAEYSMENTGSETLRVVSVCCPEDTGRHIVEKPRAAGPGEAPRLMVHEQEREVIRAGTDRLFRFLVHKDLGCQQITQFVGFIPPSKAPFHYHTYEEAIHIVEGHGVVHTDGGDAEFGPGSSIYFPVGARHCVENNGTESIRLLGVFYPSGSPGAAYEDEKH
jgi:mannose-6-phosphate isomerase-like protein (cupin superfamily)